MFSQRLDHLLMASRLTPSQISHAGTGLIISSIAQDSRVVRPGAIFCCISGVFYDGHNFAVDAVRQGAVALLVEHFVEDVDESVIQVVVDDVRQCVGPLAAALFDNPSRQMSVIGITGTNGKTTTAHLLGSILEFSGLSTKILGTLSGPQTTPESVELQSSFADMVASGTQAVAMEVSSHSLSLGRVRGTSFAASIFTNLGRDHLDFHGTQENYFFAKTRLFAPELSAVGVVNVDDSFGLRLSAEAQIPIVPFSVADVNNVEVTAIHHRYNWRGVGINVGIGGSVNVLNSLAAATTAQALGIDLATIVAGLDAAPRVSGRFESVDAGQNFVVLVDYAHTPEGLTEVLRSVRQTVSVARVILVFGCGGDRDKMKRPIMGEVAASLADIVVVTSDNPRSEDSEAIIASIVAGVPDHMRHRLVNIEVDRRKAILKAISLASPGDVVLIAGKGHETTQIIGEEIFPFDDRLVALEILRNIP